uniref:Uncharacterized protein n=1 Tax=viral metagenome TaxID=1070528 RepID=A0A6M3LQN9_9ZZZZ
MTKCRDCKRWQECAGKAHFTYSDIRWCPYQVMWILEFAETLLSGVWPIDEAIESGNSKRIAHEATFVKPEIAIGEVEKRLKSTGEVGKCLRKAAEQGQAIQTLAEPEYNVLMYLKGKKRKIQSYSQWKRGIK